jgi:hypothetical protein
MHPMKLWGERRGDMLFEALVRRTIQLLAEAEWNAVTNDRLRNLSRDSEKSKKGLRHILGPLSGGMPPLRISVPQRTKTLL